MKYSITLSKNLKSGNQASILTSLTRNSCSIDCTEMDIMCKNNLIVVIILVNNINGSLFIFFKLVMNQPSKKVDLLGILCFYHVQLSTLRKLFGLEMRAFYIPTYPVLKSNI